MARHPIIALWSHPRSMSTALERVMRERGDLTCFHEPFMYDYYVERAVRAMPHFDVDPDKPRSYEAIRAMLLDAGEAGPVFFKDMSYYVLPRMLDDREFARRLTNTFLIRDPVKAILSYYKLDPDLTLEEIGLEAIWTHLDWVRALTGETPAVLCAEAVQADTAGVMSAYWRKIGLPPAPHALSWAPEETPEDWRQVAGWHGDVAASGGIQAMSEEEERGQRAAFEAAAEKAPQLRNYLEHHRPFYDKAKALAIGLDRQ
jgi:Sulfotransferase domain